MPDSTELYEQDGFLEHLEQLCRYLYTGIGVCYKVSHEDLF